MITDNVVSLACLTLMRYIHERRGSTGEHVFTQIAYRDPAKTQPSGFVIAILTDDEQELRDTIAAIQDGFARSDIKTMGLANIADLKGGPRA